MRVLLPDGVSIDLGKGNDAEYADILTHTTTIIVIGFIEDDDGEEVAVGKIAGVKMDGVKTLALLDEELKRMEGLEETEEEVEDES